MTKKKSEQAYADLYSGPVYQIHFKYSSIMNITFITFVYGTGLPLLYPIALLSFLVLYSIERILLLKFYQAPPEFDGALNESALSTLSKASIFGLAFGYWMLSNNQIFYNIIENLQSYVDVPLTDHTIITSLRFDHAIP